jgi:plastocyanin
MGLKQKLSSQKKAQKIEGGIRMKKKSLALLLSLTLIFSIGVVSASAANSTQPEINITLNGKSVSLGQQPVVVNGRTLVPYRAIAEKLEGTVNYDGASKSVTVAKGSNVYVLGLDSKVATINGVEVYLDVPAQLISNSTFVPLRFLSENLGIQVGYESATKTVSMNTNSAPAFNVFGVTQGDILYTNQVKVSVTAFNHVLADFRTNMEAKEGQGHVHLWLDTDPSNPKLAYKLIKGEPVVFDDVEPGEHTLTIQLVGNDHKPVAPEVKKVITFETAVAPTVIIDGPKEGEVIAGDKVTVNTKVTDFLLSDFRTKNTLAAGEGHIHIWLDTDVTNPKLAYKQVDDQPATFDNLKPGDHTLTVQLVGANHKPIQPAVKQVVHFKTKSATIAAEPKNYNVSIKDFAYAPKTLTIPAGSTITFTNNDDVEHTVTAKDGSFDSGLFGQGETKTITFSKVGEYTIYCKPHNFMTATIIVE